MPSRLENFGRNLVLSPGVICRPQTESEVLEILAEHKGKKIRAVGRLHSWSEAPQVGEVLVDLSALRRVDLELDGGPMANIGAGCQIKRALNKLDRGKMTLPAVGLISEQTIAGAIATGTHGSGRHCLSHYVHAMRIACYHPETGQPTIRVLYGGEELQAAQCSLGCLGIVMSVEIKPRPRYFVKEWFKWYDTLPDVLAAEEDAPLTQFYYVPWRDKFLAQHRCEVDQKPSWFAVFYRVYWFLTIDIGLHLVLSIMVQFIRSTRLLKWFFRSIVRLTIPVGLHVVDKSQNILIMEHELFRHIELEVFVKASRLPAAMEFVRDAIESFDNGDVMSLPEVPEEIEAQLEAWWEAGTEHYTHHYPVCIRKVLPDETFLSASSGGDEPYYAISFISYARPKDRAGFFRFATFLAHSMAALFDARCHWGKFNPLSAEEVDRLYPQLPKFQEICRRFDAEGAFGNEWTERVVMGKAIQ